MRVVNLELDEDFLERFFDLTGDKVPETITLISLKKQVLNVQERIRLTLASHDGMAEDKSKVKNKKSGSDDASFTKGKVSGDLEEEPVTRKQVMLVDNLGIITYQIQMMLSNLDFSVTVVKDVYNSIEMFKENTYDLVLIDLLIPTEREGLILLNQIKKIANQKESDIIIGTMSVAGKKELKELTLEQGADFYVEKSLNWQEKLESVIMEYFPEEE